MKEEIEDKFFEYFDEKNNPYNPKNMKKEEKKSKKWEDKLISLIEKEIELATGNKSREHFSGDCKMNEILEFVRNREKAVREEMRTGIENLIAEEMLICHQENTSTSRLTSLMTKIKNLTK